MTVDAGMTKGGTTIELNARNLLFDFWRYAPAIELMSHFCTLDRFWIVDYSKGVLKKSYKKFDS